MACGIAVLGTRVDGIKDLIVEGETGLLCNVTAGGISKSISTLLDEPILRKSVGEKAREFICGKYSASKILELEKAVLNDLSHP
jgi:glycosyltransferase involved in cell wall biosynthesis